MFCSPVSHAEKSNSRVAFKPDGAYFYLIGNKKPAIHQFELSDSWNINSARFTVTLDVSSQTQTPETITFSAEGIMLWLTERASKKVFEYNLSTPWDISAAVFSQTYSGNSN